VKLFQVFDLRRLHLGIRRLPPPINLTPDDVQDLARGDNLVLQRVDDLQALLYSSISPVLCAFAIANLPASSGRRVRVFCHYSPLAFDPIGSPFTMPLSTSARIARRIGSASAGQALTTRAKSRSADCCSKRVGASWGASGRSPSPSALLRKELRRDGKTFWFSLSRFESWPGSLDYKILSREHFRQSRLPTLTR
jgi:hypothetical protein